MDIKLPETESEKTFYPTGEIKSIMPKIGNFPHGIYEEFYPNGLMKCRKQFNIGDQYGYEIEWDEKGKQTKCRKISSEYTLHEFHSNGRIKSKIGYRDGQFHGPYETWYDDGKPEVRREFQDGEVIGIQTEYYKSGGINRETIFPESRAAFVRTPGDLYLIKSYDPDGKLIFKSSTIFLEFDAKTHSQLFFDLIPKICPKFHFHLCDFSPFFSRNSRL